MSNREKLKKFKSVRVSNNHKIEFQKISYKKYLNSSYWLELKQKIINRDKKCMCCGATDQLVAHHIIYRGRGQELEKDLVCLCNSCHLQLHRLFSITNLYKYKKKKKPKQPLSDFEIKRSIKNNKIMEQ
jgi:hypothetical protein